MRLFGMDKATASATVKLIIFVLVTTMATTLLAITIGNITFGSKTPYKAIFSDATGVVKGDDIRIAGVKVGSVDSIDIVDRTQALVSFSVESGTRITDSTFATIRYRNLVGQRYIALSQGSGGPGLVHAGGTIPLSHT